jgi:hypothetical protein
MSHASLDGGFAAVLAWQDGRRIDITVFIDAHRSPLLCSAVLFFPYSESLIQGRTYLWSSKAMAAEGPPPEARHDEAAPYVGKRLIMLCDGTWKSKDSGYHRPSKSEPGASLQVPSNVTRISRLFKRRCRDGKAQIISYESGVGTGSNTLDSITGGAFGIGLAEVSLGSRGSRHISDLGDTSGCANATPTLPPIM